MSRAQDAAAKTVTERLAGAGHVAYINGGAVRDRLLGVAPNDVDVATSARPEEVAALFPDSRFVGAAFGVVLVRVNDQSIEVATFRSEGPYLDGRRPSAVRFATEEEDVRRRDFTVNGLLLDPATGEVIDHVGGRRDLEARILRAIGDPHERFREDHLRLLRAVRFAAQLGFEIEPETRAAVAVYVSQEQKTNVGSEHVLMTCGAAGGLNCVLKALLDPGDEVIVSAPYFVEYGFYAENHGGQIKVVPTRDDFNLDLGGIEAAINARTKVILINSPNNPTGQVYDGRLYPFSFQTAGRADHQARLTHLTDGQDVTELTAQGQFK